MIKSDVSSSQSVQRYDRAPPAGFDDWFRWARANDVVFVDEYDRLEISIAAFGGLTPSAIRDSVAQFEKEHPDVDGSTRIFQIRFEGGRCQGRGMDAWDKSISPHRSGQEFCEVRLDAFDERVPPFHLMD